MSFRPGRNVYLPSEVSRVSMLGDREYYFNSCVRSTIGHSVLLGRVNFRYPLRAVRGISSVAVVSGKRLTSLWTGPEPAGAYCGPLQNQSHEFVVGCLVFLELTGLQLNISFRSWMSEISMETR